MSEATLDRDVCDSKEPTVAITATSKDTANATNFIHHPYGSATPSCKLLCVLA
jgi:hypothetical protein